MNSKPYLIFSLHGLPYGIAAERVSKIFLLPELTPAIDAPEDIIGLLNLHDRVVPVMHLDLRFGNSFAGCNLKDSVMILESGELQIGAIVHRVDTVIDIDGDHKHGIGLGRLRRRR